MRFIQKLNLNFDYEVEIVLKEANTKKNAEVVEQICPERSQVVGIGNSALQNLKGDDCIAEATAGEHEGLDITIEAPQQQATLQVINP